ncbi:MAG: ELM1/GtrOC1 family putative glycosyltransferase [Wenzhouxiangella sp.]
MPLLTQRILRGLKPAAFSSARPPAWREQPEKIILGVRNGERPSSLPPVRIYLGTERGQFRAERIFIWSVEKNRDPSRIYEIYLMRDLRGFQRRFWLTGFTNYRFAIPAFANYRGRAIYNDTDQIYLKDPALLFDTPMGEAGFLSINDRDTSVMLIDCERMREVWNAGDVRKLGRKPLEARARKAGLWGKLDDGWNARDSEYDPATSHLVHFTTLHTQPWRPFPDEFVYFDNPTDPLWQKLEEEADAAGFLPVTARRPSEQWPAACAKLPSARWRDLLGPESSEPISETLLVQDLLERLPDADLPWVLERLFSLSPRLSIEINEPIRHSTERTRRSLWFWLQSLEAASRLQPHTRWTLRHRSGIRHHRLVGGPADHGPIQVLLHRKPGHNNQARAIAEQLQVLTQRELKELPVPISEAGYVFRNLLGLGLPQPLRAAASSGVLVAGGWLPSRIAQQLQAQQPGLRLILSGRKAGRPGLLGSVTIQCRHFGLAPHPLRLQTLLPLNAGRAEAGDQLDPRWQEWLNAKHRIAVLVGGDSRSHQLDPSAAADLAAAASRLASERGARLLLVTGRRSARVLDALQRALGAGDLLYRWQPKDPGNPYTLALAHSEQLIVTGESESMLADAASTGRAFMIWPTPARAPGWWQRLSSAIADRATRPHINRRGSIRPQQGRTYLCARALERHWILPPRRIELLHDQLIEQGLAVRFGDTPPTLTLPARDELTNTVSQAAQRLKIATNLEPSASTHSLSKDERRHQHS